MLRLILFILLIRLSIPMLKTAGIIKVSSKDNRKK
jgi:hypothetical protein